MVVCSLLNVQSEWFGIIMTPWDIANGPFQFDLIRCLRWYHYGCVGILPADTNIDDFECPPCYSGG